MQTRVHMLGEMCGLWSRRQELEMLGLVLAWILSTPRTPLLGCTEHSKGCLSLEVPFAQASRSLVLHLRLSLSKA